MTGAVSLTGTAPITGMWSVSYDYLSPPTPVVSPRPSSLSSQDIWTYVYLDYGPQIW